MALCNFNVMELLHGGLVTKYMIISIPSHGGFTFADSSKQLSINGQIMYT